MCTEVAGMYYGQISQVYSCEGSHDTNDAASAIEDY